MEACGFAPPLVTDRAFRDSYGALGLRPFTVRYQNEYDIVPFLPYWPALDVLAASERRSRGTNLTITPGVREQAIGNDYVPLGILRYITTACGIQYGEKAESDALRAITDALLHLRFAQIADAHSARGRYLTCVCS